MPKSSLRAALLCAIALTPPALLPAKPPASRPAPTRLDLLYLDARLLTCDDLKLPTSIKPILDAAAKQPTWHTAHAPLALLTQGQADTLTSALLVTAAPLPMLLPGQPTLITPRPLPAAPATSPSGTPPPPPHPTFALTATASPLDAQNTLPLRLHLTASVPKYTWSTDLALATPMERPLLIDLGPPLPTADNRIPPRAFLLLRPTSHPAPRIIPTIPPDQLAGEFVRSWSRTTPTCDRLSDSLRAGDRPEAIKQAAFLQSELRPLLDSALAAGPPFGDDAKSASAHLDDTLSALKHYATDRARTAYSHFTSDWTSLHTRATRLLADPPHPH